MKLVISAEPDEPYPIENERDLCSAIVAEAEMVSSEAGSDLLSENTDKEREELYERVVKEAGEALNNVGDTYKDPLGVTWTLKED